MFFEIQPVQNTPAAGKGYTRIPKIPADFNETKPVVQVNLGLVLGVDEVKCVIGAGRNLSQPVTGQGITHTLPPVSPVNDHTAQIPTGWDNVGRGIHRRLEIADPTKSSDFLSP